MLQSFPIEALSTSRRPRFELRSRSYSRSRSKLRARSKWQDVKWGLVPRYSSEMNICWKYSILTIMGMVTVLHLLTAYCIKTILNSHMFGDVCFLSTKATRPDTVCDYLYVSPLITAAVSMFWIQLFYICGRGGYASINRHIDEQPWHIVLPSVVCFTVIGITQFLYIFVLHKHTTFYCNDVKDDFPEHKAQSCEYLIGITSKTPIAWHYRTLYYSAIITSLLWLTATMIMVVRMLHAPDFKVVIEKRSKVKVPVDVESNRNEKLFFINRESVASRPFNIESDTKTKLLFMNHENALSRSVRFKRMSI